MSAVMEIGDIRCAITYQQVWSRRQQLFGRCCQVRGRRREQWCSLQQVCSKVPAVMGPGFPRCGARYLQVRSYISAGVNQVSSTEVQVRGKVSPYVIRFQHFFFFSLVADMALAKTCQFLPSWMKGNIEYEKQM